MTAAVGVVMTAFNSEAFIVEALESLIAQSLSEWTCVVVDDGSTDSTVALVEKLAANDQRIQLLLAAHAGVSQARNTGLAALPADVGYVAFLDSDDTYLPDALTDLVKVLDARAEVVGVYGMAEFMDATGTSYRFGEHSATQRNRRMVQGRSLVDLEPGADSTFADVTVIGAIWPSAVGLHRRRIIDQVGQLDVSFTRQGDWDLYVRMSRCGPFAVLDSQVAWYRRHDSNLTGAVTESIYHQDRVRFKAYAFAGNTRRQREILGHGAWRLRLAEFRRAVLRLQSALTQRDPKSAAVAGRAAIVLAYSLLRQAPPKPSRRRVRWTQPGQGKPRGDS